MGVKERKRWGRGGVECGVCRGEDVGGGTVSATETVSLRSRRSVATSEARDRSGAGGNVAGGVDIVVERSELLTVGFLARISLMLGM